MTADGDAVDVSAQAPRLGIVVHGIGRRDSRLVEYGSEPPPKSLTFRPLVRESRSSETGEGSC